MVKFVNMDYDPNTNKWWIDALDNYPSSGIMTRTWYNTEAEADVYYNSIINNISNKFYDGQ